MNIMILIRALSLTACVKGKVMQSLGDLLFPFVKHQHNMELWTVSIKRRSWLVAIGMQSWCSHIYLKTLLCGQLFQLTHMESLLLSWEKLQTPRYSSEGSSYCSPYLLSSHPSLVWDSITSLCVSHPPTPYSPAQVTTSFSANPPLLPLNSCPTLNIHNSSLVLALYFFLLVCFSY